MRLRDARPEERGAVATLVMEAYDEFRPYVDPAFVEGFMADLRDFESRSAHTQLIVAEGDGGISGAVTFFPDASRYGPGLPADWGAIRLLAVAPAARGSGLGRSLVAACIERAGARGSRAIVLHTTPFMQAARRLYEGMGFQRVPELDVELGAGVRVLGYRLPLAP
jgi:ribosomal protein S18 acetylase RimI-like enzyme